MGTNKPRRDDIIGGLLITTDAQSTPYDSAKGAGGQPEPDRRPAAARWPAAVVRGAVHEQEDQRESPRWWWFMCLRVCACV